MNRMVTRKFMTVLSGRVWVVGMLFMAAIMMPGPGAQAASDAQDARQLVEKARLSFDHFVAAKEMSSFRNLLRQAKGVFISPQVLKGAFIFGVSGGSGVFLARDKKTGEWAGPAFYTIGEVSFGLQVGAEASEVVFLALSERGVLALLSDNVKLGADIGLAIGPVGVGAEASTAALSADIISFSLSKGLYGGISLEGAVVATRDDWNTAYYNTRGLRAPDILIKKSVKSQHASGLIDAVARAAGGR